MSTTYLAGRFTGKERDQETGLGFFNARYMSSAEGRFSSPDPLPILGQKVLDPNPVLWRESIDWIADHYPNVCFVKLGPALFCSIYFRSAGTRIGNFEQMTLQTRWETWGE